MLSEKKSLRSSKQGLETAKQILDIKDSNRFRTIKNNYISNNSESLTKNNLEKINSRYSSIQDRSPKPQIKETESKLN